VLHWLKQVQAAQHAREQAQRNEKAGAEVRAARERLTPIDERLSRLLAGIPLEVQSDGLSLPALQASLRGRWRGNCHPGELGRALAKAGFERTRDWRGVDGFRAIWRKVG
jgi:hypothetical protein